MSFIASHCNICSFRSSYPSYSPFHCCISLNFIFILDVDGFAGKLWMSTVDNQLGLHARTAPSISKAFWISHSHTHLLHPIHSHKPTDAPSVEAIIHQACVKKRHKIPHFPDLNLSCNITQNVSRFMENFPSQNKILSAGSD